MSEENEDKDAIAKAVEEATAGLKAKNEELLGKLKKRQGDYEELRAEMDDIKAKADEAERAKAEKDGDVQKIREQLEAKHKREFEKLQGELDAERKVNQRLLVDNGLADALTKANVAGPYMDAAKALLTTQYSVELADQDGQRVAMIEGKPLADFVTEWAQGESGAHFVAAPKNVGGGALGGKGAPGVTKEEFAKMGDADRRALFEKDPEGFRKLAGLA